jgi:hypothetical protein
MNCNTCSFLKEEWFNHYAKKDEKVFICSLKGKKIEFPGIETCASHNRRCNNDWR